MPPPEHNCFSSVFIGEQSLLVSCAELWLSTGHSISLVVSDNPMIREWCQSKNLEHIGWTDHTEQELLAHECDYLFSLANLRILSDKILGIARISAINFHDGPLPGYTGVNTPSWAIINAEPSHAISFHTMTGEVDSGEVLLSRSFPLSSDSTSLTVNATCYELALSAFKELIALPPAGKKNTQEHIGKERSRNHYKKSDRPELAGLLDWTQSAKQLDQLLRALDFGNYENPMCTAKVWNGKTLLHAGTSALTDLTADSAPPGTIVSVADQSITISCQPGLLTLREFTDHQGLAVSKEQLHQFIAQSTENNRLPCLSEISDTFYNAIQKAAANDTYWGKVLPSVEPIAIPHFTDQPAKHGPQQYNTTGQSIPNYKSQYQTWAVIVAYFSRLNNRSQFEIGLVEQPATDVLLQHLVRDVTPCTIAIEPEDTVQDLATNLENSREKISRIGLCLRDLELRQKDSQKWPEHKLTFQLETEGEISTPPFLLTSELHLTISHDGQFINWAHNQSAPESDVVELMQKQLKELFESTNVYNTAVSHLSLSTAEELYKIHNIWNQTSVGYNRLPVHTIFENSALTHADNTALVFESNSVTYEELNKRSNQLANKLIDGSLEPKKPVGVLMDRSIEMVVALLAVLKTGCAYVPLDPTYPVARLEHMVKDADLSLILCDKKLEKYLNAEYTPKLVVDEITYQNEADNHNPEISVSANDLAYIIYTSGSTGLPKGVMVEHGNVANFFVAMDQKINARSDEAKTWLAVTSISFDISVLEIFWTLCRGFKVVLYSDERRQKSQAQLTSRFPEKPIDLSLFYWNVATEDSLNRNDKYRLLLEGAAFADKNGFAAVWNPERHFAAFGGSFPNPAVTCAAIAATTKNIGIRAGSCVAPLHSPIRIAEDWSVIDNISNGRVGVAFAAGWAPPDFAIMPDNFKNAKEIMFDTLGKVKQLWRGEKLEFDGPNGQVSVRTLPRPIQPELPVWITTAGNIESYRSAGTTGANILTHLLGQSLEEVSEKAQAYHEAWKAAGHAGNGKITLMLHTFVGENKDAVKAIVHQPMKEYLKSAMFLVKAAAWNFPTFKKLSEEAGTTIDSYFESMTDDDLDAILDFAFERYFETSGLFGSLQDAAAMIDNCKSFGIDEIACLIDFGVNDQIVLDHLPYLAQLNTLVCKPAANDGKNQEDYSIGSLISQHQATHMQCTPSMASLLMSDDDTRNALGSLEHLLVGGEALPVKLAGDLATVVNGKVSNMYGPTETTIWSSTANITENPTTVDIGHAIANTQIYIVDQNNQLMPPGIAGELLIGGDGVVRGYHDNDELTAERFISNPFSSDSEARLYKTGDLAAYKDNGAIEYLGRLDHQIKINGYRIELGEIESAIVGCEGIAQAAVIVSETKPQNRRIVAYLVTDEKYILDTENIRNQIEEMLPEFMLPTVYVKIDAMPLTPNGKIDRGSLPEPKVQSRATTSIVIPPQSNIEKAIAECWQNTLGVSAVGRKDNFFDIGGNSILLLNVLSGLNKHSDIHRSIKITDVFRYSTVESLGAFLSRMESTDSSSSSVVGRGGSRRAAMGRRRRNSSPTENPAAP